MIAKIYKITCDITNLTYYGSTTKKYLSTRLAEHKCYNSTVMKNMECPKIELIEEVDFKSREKMLERERWYIENNECCNKYIPLRTHKEWYEANKEHRKEYHHANKEHRKEQMKEWYEKNKEKLNERREEKITCECGSIIRRDSISKHLKSKKHLNFIHQHQHQ